MVRLTFRDLWILLPVALRVPKDFRLNNHCPYVCRHWTLFPTPRTSYPFLTRVSRNNELSPLSFTLLVYV